jgi:hypothetical protein
MGTPLDLSHQRQVWRRGESGQALVLFAVLAMVLMAFLAIGVDLALVIGGQRRFDQNGADAAALAVGRTLGASVTPMNDTGTIVVFGLPDQSAYSIARRYAGLNPDPASWSSSASATSTGTNQSVGLTTRTTLAVTLEYWGTNEWGATWCYSPSGPAPARIGGVPRCTLPTANLPIVGNTITPPFPDPNLPFKVRVTVSSTVKGFFSEAVGIGSGAPPPPALNDTSAACIRPQVKTGGSWQPLPFSSAPGRTMCAHAAVVISGSPAVITPSSVIPVGTGNCQLTPNAGDVLFQLWGGNPNGCGSNINPWSNVLDFSAAPRFCDDPAGGSSGNHDYKFYRLLPSLPPTMTYTGNGSPSQCTTEAGGDTWQRGTPWVGNPPYQPDLDRLGVSDTVPDVVYWVAKGVPGKISPDSNCQFVGGVWTCTGNGGQGDGVKVPVYGDCNPSCGGVQGQNIATAFYCGNGGGGATLYVCPANSVTDDHNNAANTYFFAKDQVGFQNVCTNDALYSTFIGDARFVGCRDVGIVLWASPEWVVDLNSGGTGWTTSGGGGPQRVRVARILNFRIYCDHSVPTNPATLCDQPPKSIVGNAANSTVWGRFVPLVGPGGGTPLPPSLLGNYVNLE